MLPTALLAELYDDNITNEDFERMLVVPDNNDDAYDPYKPISPSAIEKLPFVTDKLSDSSIIKFETAPSSLQSSESPEKSLKDFSSSSSTITASPTGSVSYWQDLEIYSGSSDDENRPKSNLSWTSLDNNRKFLKTINKPTFGRSKSYDVKSKYCSFCFHNREKETVYTSHALRDDANNITCPALFEVVCRYCGATGTEAHTPKYCPNKQRVSLS